MPEETSHDMTGHYFPHVIPLAALPSGGLVLGFCFLCFGVLNA